MRKAGPLGLAMLLKKASLVGAFFMAAIWHLPAMALCPAPPDVQLVGVREVGDGDTLRLVDGRRVRLIGLNAPEIGRKGQPSEPFAVTARQRLQALVKASGGLVGLQPGVEPRDKYGRTLAHVYGRSGDNLEAQLLSEGLGYRVAVAPNVALTACHQRAEQAARRAGVGVWRQPAVLGPEQLNHAGFALISGQVQSIERNRGGIWLSLGDDLVLQVPTRLLRDFPSSFADGLKGRTVEARGWVLDRSRKGSLTSGQARWLMQLTHPSMLERQER